MLRVTVEDVADVRVVSCRGRMVMGEPLETVRDAVLCHSNRIVRLDMTALTRIDAAGLGLIASLCCLAYAAEIDFRVVNPTKRVRELLKAVRLDFAIDVAPYATAPAVHADGQAGILRLPAA